MGKTLRELSSPEIVTDLIRAHCDEIIAWYLYYFLAQNVSGNLYPELQSLLEETAKEELEHASQLADMIVKLGGKIISDPCELENGANFPVIVPPEEINLENICDIVAESESNAIRNYSSLSMKYKDINPSAYALVSEILVDETDHEESFENLKK